MNPSGRTIALYGRFSSGARDRLQRRIIEGGGAVTRDLTRRSDALVVGAVAMAFIDSGALAVRLRTAKERGVPVLGERAFAGAEPPVPTTLPLSQTAFTRESAEILAAFDLIALDGDNIRFGDAAILRTATEILDHGRPLGDVVRILTRARDLAPLGRHKIVLTPSGEAALQWKDGLTTLEGQGHLPLDDDNASLDDLFEGAAMAESEGELDDAARLYDTAGRADRADPIAPYNFANIRLAQGAHEEAILAYQRALSRDAGFVEARYNLAQALEAAGKLDEAAAELDRALAADPTYADAVFNLAQLRMAAGDLPAAQSLYARYLTLGPPPDWAATARKALLYCTAQIAFGTPPP